MGLRKDDFITDCDIYSPPSNTTATTKQSSNSEEMMLLAVTDRGFGKTIDPHVLRTSHRKTKGVRVIKYKTIAAEDGSVMVDHLRSLRVCSMHDDVVLSTLKGKTIRQKIHSISSQSRHATGVKLQTIDEEDDYITSVNIIPAEEERKDSADDEEAEGSKRVVVESNSSAVAVPITTTTISEPALMKPKRGRRKKSAAVSHETGEAAAVETTN
jgi:DNA gyrase/topoisomerase IV subunit A